MHTAPVPRASILVVDDEEVVRESLRLTFKGGHKLHTAANAQQALSRIGQHAIDLVFLDILLPDMNGIDLLKEIKQIAPATRVIMLTAFQEIETAVEAMKAGAFDFLSKPFDLGHVQTLAERALAWKKERIKMDGDQIMEGLAGRDACMRNIYKIIESISPCEGNVLIQGASGTGKKLIARAVHNRSTRAASPYVAIDCDSMPATLMERGAFGPRRWTLNGALIDGTGNIDLAHTGSIFLNNINYLPLDVQDRLLRLIQHKEFECQGSPRPIKADVRIIAATNQNLKALVDARLFREDLYYHLNELPIYLPLLRERGEDIGLLLEHFLKQNALRNGAPRKHFSPRARSTLTTCDWPSRVREFEHLVERICQLHKDRPNLPPHDHPSASNGLKLKKATRTFERQHILAALKAVNGSRSQAARRLGIHRNTLLLKTKELGIDFR